MDYKEKVIALLKSQELSKEQKEKLEGIFPELAESEDEKIRKDLIEWFEEFSDSVWRGNYKKDIIAWLEKQESVREIVSRCKASWYNEGKIQGQIEGLSDEEKYQQGWHDALEKQCKQKPADKVEPRFKVGDWLTLRKNDNTYTIEAITPDELDALYNAILHVPLPYRRELYNMKTQIENEKR